MSAVAPAEVEVHEVRISDEIDDDSAASDAGDGGACGGIGRLEPSAPPASLAAPVDAWSWSSLLQVKRVFVKVAPALALMLGAVAYAFPKTVTITKNAGRAAFKLVSSALTVVEHLTELPDSFWAAALFVLALL